MSAPAISPENPYAGQGSVLLDIGGDIGALVVTMPAELDGSEIEIRPVGGPDLRLDPLASGNQPRAQGHAQGQAQGHAHGHPHDHSHSHDHAGTQVHPHVAVVSRPAGDQAVPSLVFGELVQGSYELYAKGTHEVTLTVSVIGGEVSSAAWPS
jgi:ABC-type Zn2+ transport system substrate-binding protein/surface adhesin